MSTTKNNENLEWEYTGGCNLDLNYLLEKEMIGAEYPSDSSGIFHKYLREYFTLRISKKQLGRISAMVKNFKAVQEDNSHLSNKKTWLRKKEVTFSESIPQNIVEEINQEVNNEENLNLGTYEFKCTRDGYTLIYIV